MPSGSRLPDTLLDRPHNHEIDGALLATAVEEQEFETLPLFEEPFWVAYSRDHAFYEKDRIRLRDLAKENLLLLAEGQCLAHQAMKVCHMRERQTHGEMADLRASSLETLIQLVGAGNGIPLVPALAVSGSWTAGSGVVAQPLAIAAASTSVAKPGAIIGKDDHIDYNKRFCQYTVFSDNLPKPADDLREGRRGQ